jgi:ribosomal protein S18 acetylase RimI-like enzyme
VTVTWRDELPADETFVRRLIGETVIEELGARAWPASLREPLVEMQSRARRLNAGAAGRIVLLDGEPAGWLAVAETEEEIRLVDIVIAPEHRGKGAGSVLLCELLAAADQSGKPVRLSVLTGSPAVRLYERLGFRRTGGDEVRYWMERPTGSTLTER